MYVESLVQYKIARYMFGQQKALMSGLKPFVGSSPEERKRGSCPEIEIPTGFRRIESV